MEYSNHLIKSVTINIPYVYGLHMETTYYFCDACKCLHEFVFGDKDIKSQSEWILLWYKIANKKIPDDCILRKNNQ